MGNSCKGEKDLQDAPRQDPTPKPSSSRGTAQSQPPALPTNTPTATSVTPQPTATTPASGNSHTTAERVSATNVDAPQPAPPEAPLTVSCTPGTEARVQVRVANPGPLYAAQPYKNPEELVDVSVSLAAKRSDPKGLVPAPVSEMCNWLLTNDMKGRKKPGWSLGVEGLFRKPGPGRQIKEFIQAYDEDPHAKLPDKLSTHFACSMIVKYFMGITKIGKPIWGDTEEEINRFKDEFDDVMAMEQKGFSKEAKVERMRALMLTLPPANYETWKVITHLLYEACKPENTEKNKMESVHFAMCVMPQIKWGFIIDNYPGIFENSKEEGRTPDPNNTHSLVPQGRVTVSAKNDGSDVSTATNSTKNRHNPSIGSIRSIGSQESKLGGGTEAYRQYVRSTQQAGRAPFSSEPSNQSPQSARHTVSGAVRI